MLTTTELTGILVRIKARLAFGRQAGKASLLNGIGAVVGVVGTIGAVVFIVGTGGAQDTAVQIMFCLLYTSPSPRDRG